MRTWLRCRLEHARAQTLAGHLKQAETGDAAHLNARAVGFEAIFETLFNGCVVLALFHIDEIDDDETGKVAQTRLAGDFFGGLKVGFERGFLDRALFGGAARVHIHGNQSLGHIDHDIPAGFELHRRVEHRAEVAFHLITREKRQRVAIVFHVFGMGRHDHFHEVFCFTIAGLALNNHLIDLFGIEIADGAFDQIALFVDFRGCHGLQRELADLFPHTLEVIIIAFHLGLGPLRACGADDETRPFRHFHLARDFLELLAVIGIGDFARNAAAACGVWHQDAIATCQAEVSRERGAFIAALFFDHLHQKDLAHFDHFLDFVATWTRLAARANFLGRVIICDTFDILVFFSRCFRRVVFVVAFGLVTVRRVFGIGLSLCNVFTFGRACFRL